MILGIFYKKSQVKNNNPIVVSNGRSEIYTNSVILNNISGQIIFDSAKKLFPIAARSGTTTPLLLKIDDDESNIKEKDIMNFTKPELNEYLKGIDSKEKKRIIERIRYRKNNLGRKQSFSRKEITLQ